MSLVDGIGSVTSDPEPHTSVVVARQTADKSTTHDAPLGFGDLLDIINPLQHIPGVAEVYRAVTGDQMSDGARYAGNALYGLALGGPLGLAGMTAYSFAGQAMENRFSETTSAVPPIELGGGSSMAPAHADTEELSALPVSKPEHLQGEVLGAKIGTTGDLTGYPLDLQMLSGHPVQAAKTERQVIASAGEPAATDAVIPDQLTSIADHAANRLPLDVLEVLQERHKSMVSNERS
ncbi:hypothetical protein [Roseibium sp.]|uniref:hypothetical protein n=1 Tax=Roseibium sp. TaxID=1936156 RepID=UPI003A96ADAE